MTTLHKRNEERTHEENQERSLIAASHRGDRDMDARLESARKASEVHKRRTGKALHITPYAVVNELPYPEIGEEEGEEEEDEEEDEEKGEKKREVGKSKKTAKKGKE